MVLGWLALKELGRRGGYEVCKAVVVMVDIMALILVDALVVVERKAKEVAGDILVVTVEPSLLGGCYQQFFELCCPRRASAWHVNLLRRTCQSC